MEKGVGEFLLQQGCITLAEDREDLLSHDSCHLPVPYISLYLTDLEEMWQTMR